jgi:hypothetical protein
MMMPKIIVSETAKSNNYTGPLMWVSTDCGLFNTGTGLRITFKYRDEQHTIYLKEGTIVNGQIHAIVDLEEKKQEIYISF